MRYLGGVGLVALAYAAAAPFKTPLEPGGLSAPTWSPAGIAVALLVLFGPRFWPGVLIGALLEPSLSPNGANEIHLRNVIALTVQPVVASVVLRRLRFDPGFGRLRDVVLFLAIAVVVAPTLCATVVTGLEPSMGTLVSPHWLSWWMVDARSILTFAPVFIAWRVTRFAWQPRRVAEVIALFGSLGIAGFVQLGLGGWRLLSTNSAAAVYSLLPWLVWAAVRLGPFGAALANAMLSILAMAATRRGIGPFAEDTGGALVAVQVFVVCSAATTLC